MTLVWFRNLFNSLDLISTFFLPLEALVIIHSCIYLVVHWSWVHFQKFCKMTHQDCPIQHEYRNNATSMFLWHCITLIYNKNNSYNLSTNYSPESALRQRIYVSQSPLEARVFTCFFVLSFGKLWLYGIYLVSSCPLVKEHIRGSLVVEHSLALIVRRISCRIRGARVPRRLCEVTGRVSACWRTVLLPAENFVSCHTSYKPSWNVENCRSIYVDFKV